MTWLRNGYAPVILSHYVIIYGYNSAATAKETTCVFPVHAAGNTVRNITWGKFNFITNN